MQSLAGSNVISILQNTLNHVDARLTGHGERVSYRVYRMLRMLGAYDEPALRDMCLLALLHDIGAYRAEEIDQMLRFETEDVWDHSIWGYLFLRHFSPLSALAPAILYHHADQGMLAGLDPALSRLAQCIHIADRADIRAMRGEKDAMPDGTRFRSDIAALYADACPRPPEPGEIEADAGYQRLMRALPFDARDTEAYLRMNVLAIDFRSPNTSTHTVTTSACSRLLATHMRMPPDDVQTITDGAMLHDLGKTGIPLEILEYPGKLSPQAMRVMKTHVEMTEIILRGNVPEGLFHVAIRHHEKLDGSGYPHQLKARDLTPADRVVAVADIVSALYEVRSYKESYSKNRILGITNRMAQEGLIDADIVAVMTRNFEEITACIDGARDPISAHFDMLQQSYIALQTQLDPLHGTPRAPLSLHDDGYSTLSSLWP